MKARKYFLTSCLLLVLVMSCLSVQAQENTQSQNDLQNRVLELESQLEMMKAQIESLKKILESKTQNETKTSQTDSTQNQAVNKEITKQEAKQETNKLGIDLGSVRVTPYGTIYFNAFGNSGGTNNADIPLFATPSGVGNLSASVRQTRLGLKIEGPKIFNAKSSGVIEADFFGGFPAVGLGENFGVVRMRVAYAKLDWEKTSLLAGQDWVIFAPNNPASIASAAIPQLAAAGNPWTRLPQIRVEQRFNKGRVLLQGAIVSPSTGDFPNNTAAFFLQTGAGAASRVPSFESRIAFNDKNWLGTKKAGSIGVSTHYGRARITSLSANNKIDSLGVALDWNSPLNKRVSFSGEAFVGRNLGMFQAGIFQGYNTSYIVGTNAGLNIIGARAIGTRGGWTQLGWNLPAFQDRVTVYGSIGIDDPRDEDLRSVSLTDWRKRNLAYTFSLHYKLSQNFNWALEYRRFETFYNLSRKQTANHINLGFSYTF